MSPSLFILFMVENAFNHRLSHNVQSPKTIRAPCVRQKLNNVEAKKDVGTMLWYVKSGFSYFAALSAQPYVTSIFKPTCSFLSQTSKNIYKEVCRQKSPLSPSILSHSLFPPSSTHRCTGLTPWHRIRPIRITLPAHCPTCRNLYKLILNTAPRWNTDRNTPHRICRRISTRT